MKLWRLWDVLFPVCPLGWQAVSRVRRTLKDPKISLLARRWGPVWAVFSDKDPAHNRFVHRGSGAVYRGVTLRETEAEVRQFFGRYPSPRRVWVLEFPYAAEEQEALEQTLLTLGVPRKFVPGWEIFWSDGTLFYGSEAAIRWLQQAFQSNGLDGRCKRVFRHRIRRARLFRLTHFGLSLREALEDNGQSWRGLSSSCAFDEVR